MPRTPETEQPARLPDLLRRASQQAREGQLDESRMLLERALQSDPDNDTALDLLASILLRSGDVERAAGLIARMIVRNPQSAAAHSNFGYAMTRLGRLDPALASYDTAIALDPRFASAHYSRGVVLDALARHEEALAAYDDAIALKPDYVAAHINRGIACADLKRFDHALASYDRAIALMPNNPAAHFNRGNTLAATRRHEDALAAYDAALALDPDHAEAHCNRGIALCECKRYDLALASFDAALRLKPDYADALNNRGNALTALRRHADAIASYDAALAIAPGLVEAQCNRGDAFYDLRCWRDALGAYDRAIAGDADFAPAHYGRGLALTELGRLAEALSSYERAHALAPEMPYLPGKLLHLKMMLCDWRDLADTTEAIARGIARGDKATAPFPFLAASDCGALHRRAAEIYAADWTALRHALPDIDPPAPRDKIHIGYFSADFHDHATAHLMAELFECHDRARFAITAFSFGPDTGDAMQMRLRQAFDGFVDVRAMSDADIARLSRKHAVDIAVDLKGYTGDCRPAIFAHRAAPLQASYLGYPGTMGADFIDYLIADPVLIPERARTLYAEKIVYLPDCYQVNDGKRRVAPPPASRAQAGLPEHGFVFCAFNASYKITPGIFDSWMRILARVEGGVLWLLRPDRIAEAHLRREGAARGIAAERLIFAPRAPSADHLARLGLADLFLDTRPYNAHTTASDALRAALPIVTWPGESFASRVAASLLHAAGLPELIVSSQAEYEDLAVALAQDRARLAALREMLSAHLVTSPLFDAGKFARAIEAAYTAMQARRLAGSAPDHLFIRATE